MVMVVVRTGNGAAYDPDADFLFGDFSDAENWFDDAVEVVTLERLGPQENQVAYKNKRYYLQGGTRTPYFICLTDEVEKPKARRESGERSGLRSWHSIRFDQSGRLDVWTSNGCSEQIQIDSPIEVKTLRAYIIETEHGPAELCDLELAGGDVAIGVPYGTFSYLE